MMDPVPYQCFLSYARDDNSDHDGVVDRLKRELAGRFEAATGAKLSIFLDKEAIGWGENWREKIAAAITGSTLFVPIITMRYFNHQACRDEFSAFHSAATAQGVTDLILPIILAGAKELVPDHQDELVRAVEQLNYQPIYEEFEAGYDSSAWKRRIGALVTGLQEALSKAAERLTDTGLAASGSGGVSDDIIAEIDEQTITHHMEAMTRELEALAPLFDTMGAIVTDRFAGRESSQMTAGQRAFLFGALAEELRGPAAEFGEKAASLEANARRADVELRAIVAELYDIDPGRTEAELEELRLMASTAFKDSHESFAQISELEKVLRTAALASVPLRRALHPITTGLRAMNTAMQIITAWQSIQVPGADGV